MKITTRDLLAELLVEALDDHITATALRCLARACRASRHAPFSMAVDQLLEPAPASSREAVLAKLQASPLLTWGVNEQSGQVDLCGEAPACHSEPEQREGEESQLSSGQTRDSSARVYPEQRRRGLRMTDPQNQQGRVLVTLTAVFVSEWREIADKLTRFSTALQDWSPDTQDTPMRQALKKGALLFNHQLFFEVHEVLEAQWMLANGKEKIFLQGLIQIAVALYHLQNRNLRGALLLFQDGIEKLAPHQPAFLGVDLSPFLTEVKRLRNHLQYLAPEDIAQVRTMTIPRLNFTTNQS
jgi:predicted metal-dependent hydrolase